MPHAVETLREGHEEKFRYEDSNVEFLKADGTGPRRFRCVAYTGKDVARAFGRMVVNVAGINRGAKMGMLLEHDDLSGVAVCDGHSATNGVLKLEGYFLDEVASEGKSKALIAKADQGWPLKMSIGIRFRKHSFIEDGVEFEVNGRTLKGPMVCVDESDLFETSFIHVNPADLDTEANVMRAKAQEHKRMAEVAKENEEAPAQSRDQILAEGEQRAIARIRAENEFEAALHQARPGKGEQSRLWREDARKNMSIDQVRAAGTNRMEKRLAKYEARDKEQTAALEALKKLAPQAGSRGVNMDKLVSEAPKAELVGPMDERVYAVLREKPAIMQVFSGDHGGYDARKVIAAWLKTKDRKCSRDGRPILCDLLGGTGRVSPGTLESLQRMAFDVQKSIESARLDVGSSAPDLSKVTVNGFQGQFYNSYEEELSKNWSLDLSFQIPTDQQAEIVRWLGAPPMLQEWKGPRIAKDIPIYQQLIQAVKFEATLDVSRFDWDHQKFDLIAKSFGELGAVASQHWDIRFSNLLEANPTAYDGFSLFSPSHTLGGDSGTIINDYNASGSGGIGSAPTLNVANPAMPTQLEWANIILQLTPKFRSFAWANGLKMHGTARQWGIMVHPDLEGNLQAAVSSERLDLGASNPLYGQRSQYKVMPNAYLTDATKFYIFRLDTSNKALLRAEPDPIEMMWMGPGSQMAFMEDKYAMGLRCVRSIAPGAFESVLSAQLGNL